MKCKIEYEIATFAFRHFSNTVPPVLTEESVVNSLVLTEESVVNSLVLTEETVVRRLVMTEQSVVI